MRDVRIATIMTKEVLSVSPECPLPELVDRLCESGGACAVVCENDEPVGLISTTDLTNVLSSQLSGKSDAAPLSAMEVMGFPVFSVSEDKLMSDAMTVIRDRGFSRVAVVDSNNRLVGIVTQSDLLKAHSEQLDARRESLELLVADRTSELVAANEELHRLSMQDGLMGIGNRRAMASFLDETHQLAIRFDTKYSVVMCDIDSFKSYNDYYGHPQADSVLRQVAEAMDKTLRRVDKLFRYGGEELLAVLPQTEQAGAMGTAERLRSVVEGLAIPHEKSPFGVVTISCGVAPCFIERNLARDSAHVVSQADRALYRAKQGGRNRIGA